MGRKIPGKKHRTIKDPYKQRQKRLESLNLKINNPPSNCDEQPIPKSLLRIIELKEKSKKQNVPQKRKGGKVKTKKRLPSIAKVLDKIPNQPGFSKPDKFIPNLFQKPNESAKSYLQRVDLMTQSLINEVEFEKKFGVQILKNPDTGKVIEVNTVKTKRSKRKKQKLSEKRKEKLTKKRDELKNCKEFSQLKDKVEFGEVVHRPPVLPALKKLPVKEQKPNSTYHNLLLNNLIKEQPNSGIKQSCFDKEKAEYERKHIVEAYRKAKKEKKKDHMI